MVSKANYVAITVIMGIILVLFQFTGVSENVVLRDGENVSVDAADTDEMEAVKAKNHEQTVQRLRKSEGTVEVGFVGRKEPCLKVGQEWCLNQKKTYRFYSSLQEASNDPDCPEFLLADGKILEEPEASDAIVSLGKRKCSVVFSGLPDLEKVKQFPDILKSLGIRNIEDESVELDGFKLFAGLLLGGETVYDDYKQTLPYVELDESVHVYAVGQSGEEWFQKLENEKLPALIWRNYNHAGRVYVVNSNFLEEKLGAGILTGLAADMVSAYIYPIVNAQISAVANYPMLSDENKTVMEEEYGQDSIAVTRDVLWPVIAGIYYDSNERMTVLTSPRLDYNGDGKMDETLLKYFYKQVTKMRGEMGISGDQKSQIPLEEKLLQDTEILRKNLPNYEIRVFYAGDMAKEEYKDLLEDGELLDGIHTVLRDYSEQEEDQVFSFSEGNVLELMLYMNSSEHSNEDDFRLRCFQTAYGYYASKLDAAKIIYPESETDLWNNVSENWAKYYRPYREIFKYFDKLTVTAADKRVRSYLDLDYETDRKEDIITLNVRSEEEQNYFMVKTHGEKIKDITGAEYEELETDWYLIKTQSPQITIKLEQTNRSVYE